MGVTSADSFLSNPEAQDRAYLNFTLKNYGYLKNDQSYIGQSIDNVTITESGLLAGVHLVGHFALEKFLTSKGKYVPKDGNHPPVLVTTYLKDFGGYDFVYDKKTNTFINSSNITPQHSEVLPQLEGSSLHKAAVAIGSAHHISIAPRQKNGTGKQSSTHSASHANTSAAELTASQVRSFGAAALLGASNVAALGAYSVQRGSYVSLAKNLVAPGSPSSTAAIALAQYRASTAAQMVKAAQTSTAVAMLGSSMQNLSSSAMKLSPGLPFSIAPVGLWTRRVTGSANVAPGSPQFARAKPSSQNAAASARNYEVAQSIGFQQQLSYWGDRQARLPPDGATGFDPRLTPAWAGVKLPN